MFATRLNLRRNTDLIWHIARRLAICPACALRIGRTFWRICRWRDAHFVFYIARRLAICPRRAIAILTTLGGIPIIATAE